MKFSIDKHILIDPLKRVASALPSKQIIPILSGILFLVDDNGLSMTAGNSHVYIRAIIDPDDFESNKHGVIVLPGSKVVDIVDKSGDVLTFEANGFEVTIKSGTNKFKLIGSEHEDYPNIPDVEAEIVTVPGELFKKVVRKTLFATAGEKTSAPILMGINFEFSNGRLRATATNRNRMARTVLEIKAESSFSTVVSKDNLTTLVKIAPDSDINFKFGYDGFIANMKGLTFYSRVLEGTYPDVDRILKENYQFSASVNISDLIVALENVDIVAKEEKVRNERVHKAIATISDVIYLQAATEVGSVDATVDLMDVSGDGLTLAFNISYILEALKSLDSEIARIHFGNNLEPFKISGVDDPDSTHIVLPYRV